MDFSLKLDFAFDFNCAVRIDIGQTKNSDTAFIACRFLRYPALLGKLYSSRLVVAANTGIESLDECNGKIAAINDPDSNSGMNVLRYAIATLQPSAPYLFQGDQNRWTPVQPRGGSQRHSRCCRHRLRQLSIDTRAPTGFDRTGSYHRL